MCCEFWLRHIFFVNKSKYFRALVCHNIFIQFHRFDTENSVSLHFHIRIFFQFLSTLCRFVRNRLFAFVPRFILRSNVFSCYCSYIHKFSEYCIANISISNSEHYTKHKLHSKIVPPIGKFASRPEIGKFSDISARLTVNIFRIDTFWDDVSIFVRNVFSARY